MSGLEVSGGAGGVAVGLDTLEVAAGRLRDLSDELSDVAGDIAAVAAHPFFAVAGVLAPAASWGCERDLASAAGPWGAAGESLALRGLAEAVTACVLSYRAGEAAAERAVDEADQAVGTAVGAALAPLVLPVAGLTAAGWVVAKGVQRLDARWLRPHLRASLGLTRDVQAEAGPLADRLVYEQPWVLEHLVGGAEGLLTGLGEGQPLVGLGLAVAARRAGVPYPSASHEDAAATITALGGGLVLDESGFAVRTTATAVDPAAEGWRRPAGLADLVANDSPTSGGDQVRVTGLPTADGGYAWVVDIPGTQTFDVKPGAEPFDMTSNMALVAGGSTLTMAAVSSALADSKARVGRSAKGVNDPVLLSGHSQGGLTAARLAADPAFRRRHRGVSHVVTSGAPIGGVTMPKGVSVLSLEHRQDLVPMLDGERNPDSGEWVTVRRDLDDAAERRRSTAAHENLRYVETAALLDRQLADEPSLREWRAGALDFLGAPGGAGAPVVVDYDVERVPRE
ncbi:hypothetical protein GCM10022199_11130 [Marihabitans asiaticum]|uniref:PGAP1-like protein n=1 Tax=Marihabitans asiaticum TaxID=415218 RepID=A0A560WHL7_9MICO|nr:hypothetical protein [Marihabitans asiaticum]TWD17129.1 hypothetical protein FB557_0691 [Marihabitans asiaticum]